LREEGHDFDALTVAYGRNAKDGGAANALLAEANRRVGRNSLYGRFETLQVETDLLLTGQVPPEGVEQRTDRVTAFTIGGVRDFIRSMDWELGLGGNVTFYGVPGPLEATHGARPVSFQVFLRVRPPASSMGRMWNMNMTQPMRGHGMPRSVGRCSIRRSKLREAAAQVNHRQRGERTMRQLALAIGITVALAASTAACGDSVEQESQSTEQQSPRTEQQSPGVVSNVPVPSGATAVHSDTHAAQMPSAIRFKSNPDPPKTGENRFEVTVTDHEKQPITDADVSAEFYMPAMPSMNMPEMRQTIPLKHQSGGTYLGLGSLMMAGAWDVSVSVKRGGTEIAGTKFKVTVQ
jgi:nitrogen fixation protein FixH